jgi:hypothetical protein
MYDELNYISNAMHIVYGRKILKEYRNVTTKCFRHTFFLFHIGKKEDKVNRIPSCSDRRCRWRHFGTSIKKQIARVQSVRVRRRVEMCLSTEAANNFPIQYLTERIHVLPRCVPWILCLKNFQTKYEHFLTLSSSYRTTPYHWKGRGY